MKRAVVTILIALSLPASALAFEEPDGFKGARWGQSEGHVRAALAIDPRGEVVFDCYAIPVASKHIGDRSCRASAAVGTIPVRVTTVFRADRLIHISFAFDVRHFDQMEASFIGRFGEPEPIKESIVKSGAGVEYVNRTLSWRGQTVWVTLRKYAGTVKDSSASYTLLSDLEVSEKLKREGAGRGAEDLK
jgi:hypothetical protein